MSFALPHSPPLAVLAHTLLKVLIYGLFCQFPLSRTFLVLSLARTLFLSSPPPLAHCLQSLVPSNINPAAYFGAFEFIRLSAHSDCRALAASRTLEACTPARSKQELAGGRLRTAYCMHHSLFSAEGLADSPFLSAVEQCMCTR